MTKEQIEALHAAARQEAAELIQRATKPREGELIKQRIARAAQALKWQPRRTARIWHGTAKHTWSWEMDMLRCYGTKARAKA